jgi:hypothetical protein
MCQSSQSERGGANGCVPRVYSLFKTILSQTDENVQKVEINPTDT